MLHIQCMSIASMAKQFLSNNGTKDVFINLDITQKNITKLKLQISSKLEIWLQSLKRSSKWK